MAIVSVQPVNTQTFRAYAAFEKPTLRLTLSGNGDMAAVEPVRKFLEQAHTAALTYEVRDVVVDLQQVEFLNSSCLKGFVRWLNLLQGVQGPRRYTVRFLPNHSRPWQRASLLALAGFATDLVSVEGLTA